MDFSAAMQISASGLAAQRKRMEAISSNLANMETTRTPEGGPYRRKEVVVGSLPLENDFAGNLNDELSGALQEVVVTNVVEDQKEPVLVYKPDHPDADERGE